LLGIHNLGAESFVAGGHCVGAVVAIDLGHGCAGGNGHLRWRKSEVIDVHDGRGR
jgi:hypothetical protein